MRYFSPNSVVGKNPLSVGMGIGLIVTAHMAVAQTWDLTTAPVTNWSCLTCSADGTRLAAGANIGLIYTSTNAGLTWTPTSAPALNWNAIDSSADGTVLVAAAWGVGVYYSTNSGATWNACAPIPYEKRELYVACSTDGRRLVASFWSPFLVSWVLTSTNTGMTWATTNSFPYIFCAASSADGSMLMVGSGVSTAVFISYNSAQTWTGRNFEGQPVRLACSADGRIVTAAGSGTWISTNFGTNWTSSGFSSRPVACSADGTKIVTANADGIYISEDVGASWTSNAAPALDWYAVAMSADGARRFAAARGGGIYTSQVTPKATLLLAHLEGELIASWTVPSTPFVLEQNMDLTTSSWIVVTNEPVLNLTNLHYEVAMPIIGPTRFFRLRSL